MQLIAAVDNNWAIGRNGKLLVTIPGDMKFFRDMTMGKTVIAGRKTLATFPGGKPLKGRKNIILSKNPSFSVRGAETAHSVEEAIRRAKELEEDEDNIFVIGGGSIYRAFLPYCDKAVITKIDLSYEADVYFPDLDRDEKWFMEWESEEQTCFDIIYTFTRYRRTESGSD